MENESEKKKKKRKEGKKGMFIKYKKTHMYSDSLQN